MIMKVSVHAVNFTVDRKLVDFVQERMDKLEKYYDKVVSSDVYLKVEKTSEKENKIVEVKINVPGDELLVKKQCKSFEEATEMAAESLERMLLKRKEKISSHI
jgi:putative sigma-54 modulation protein